MKFLINKMYILFFIILIPAVIFLNSCGEEESSEPTPTTDSPNVSANIRGAEVFDFEYNNPILKDASVEDWGVLRLVEAYKYRGTDKFTIRIYIKDRLDDRKVFNLANHEDGYITVDVYDGLNEVDIDKYPSNTTGKIELTEFNPNLVKGNFEFTALNEDSTKTITVTSGKVIAKKGD